MATITDVQILRFLLMPLYLVQRRSSFSTILWLLQSPLNNWNFEVSPY